jgi:hypothetical protein
MEEKIIIKKPPKSPTLAGLLAGFIPFGTGALYNGQIRKAIVFFFIFTGLITMQPSEAGQPFLGLLLAGFWIYQIFDAVRTAKSINRRALKEEEEEIEVEEFPDFVKTGSVFWGVVLMFIGCILLLANFGVLSYNSLFEFWPVAVIIIGVKLVVDYYAKGKREE